MEDLHLGPDGMGYPCFWAHQDQGLGFRVLVVGPVNIKCKLIFSKPKPVGL